MYKCSKTPYHLLDHLNVPPCACVKRWWIRAALTLRNVIIIGPELNNAAGSGEVTPSPQHALGYQVMNLYTMAVRELSLSRRVLKYLQEHLQEMNKFVGLVESHTSAQPAQLQPVLTTGSPQMVNIMLM